MITISVKGQGYLRPREDFIFAITFGGNKISKKYDLVGKVFGKLTVIEKTTNPNRKDKRTAWLCKCDCGNYCYANSSSLNGGKSIQCSDCAHAMSGLKRRKDLVGTRFGKLTVTKMIYPDDRKADSKTYCECVCDCGNVIRRPTSDLIRRKNSLFASCGCAKDEIADSRSKDIINIKFGRLKAIEEFKQDGKRKIRCQCDCGNNVIVAKSDLLFGHTQSCGCLQADRASESNQKDWTGYVSDYGVKILHRASKNSANQWLWNCKCPCGNTFKILPIKVANGHTTSCGCRNRSSKESMIEKYLQECGVEYRRQYSFPDCKNKYKLKFDFAIFINGEVFCLIEYDGKQHYTPIEYFGGYNSYLLTVQRDAIKNKYCSDNNIPLLRLKYDLKDDEIKEKIANILNP